MLNFQTKFYDVLIDYQDSYEKGKDDAYFIQSILKRFLDVNSVTSDYEIDVLSHSINIMIGVEVESTEKFIKPGWEKWPKGFFRPGTWNKGCSIPLRKINYMLQYPDRDCFWIKLNFDATQSLIVTFERIKKAIEIAQVEYIIGDCRAYLKNRACYLRCWCGINPARNFAQGYREKVNGSSKCAMMVLLPWDDVELGKYSCDNGFREWAEYINRFCFKRHGIIIKEPKGNLITFKDSHQLELF